MYACIRNRVSLAQYDSFDIGRSLRAANRRAMHLSDSDRNILRSAALLHDVGKITIPIDVLTKPGSLHLRRWTRCADM